MSIPQVQNVRRRVIAGSALFNIISKGLYFLLVFVAFSLTLPYLGPERFGIFTTILGFGSILSILDLGIGNVLIGSVARLNAGTDREALGIEIASGLIILCGFGSVLLVTLCSAAYFVPVERLFKGLTSEHYGEVRSALLIFVAGYSLTLPLQGIQRITQGLQKAYITYAFSAGFTAVAFVLLFWASRAQASIPVLLVVTYLVPALAPIGVSPVVLRLIRKIPLSFSIVRAALSRFLGQGGVFFLLQLGALAGWGIDAVLTSSQLGPASAGVLAIAQRLFQLSTYPLAIVNGPLWPAYADAHARNDRQFIHRALRSSFFLTLATAAIGALFLHAFSAEIFQLWLRRDVSIPAMLLLFCAVWSVFEATGNSYAMFLNGMNFLKVQLATNAAFFLLAIPLKFWLIRELGLHGLPLATLIAYSIAIVLPYALLIRPHSRWDTTS